MPSVDQLQSYLAAIGAFLIVAGPVVKILLAAAEQLQAVAKATAWQGDDKAAGFTVGFLRATAQALDAVARVIPHVAVKGQTQNVPRDATVTLPPAPSKP